jgi:tRNA-specific 2-thiouridylase
MKKNICNMKSQEKKVFVGMSGGVDSSVSAALLECAGYDVTGVFIKVWQPDWMDCNWREDRLDAMRVAAALDIPFITLDLEKEYKRDVVDYMIAEYRSGRTPNPDVMCNKSVKFGAFYDYAIKNGTDFVATGHYARIVEKAAPNTATFLGLSNSLREIATVSPSGHSSRTLSSSEISARSNKLRPFESSRLFAPKKNLVLLAGAETDYHLLAGTDPNKDQSYFLWNLRQEQLSRILFPIGDIEKPEVRKLAKKFKLPNADKKDSQGLCFIGKVDIKEFLSHYIEPKEGDVLDDKGKIIGHHDGTFFLTIGERHGFVIDVKTPNDQPYFIISKDIEKNTITVSNKDKQGLLTEAKTFARLEKTNWISGTPEIGKKYSGRAHYRQPLTPLVFTLIKEKEKIAEIEFDKPQNALTPGQSLVVYDGEVCLGGGIIL